MEEIGQVIIFMGPCGKDLHQLDQGSQGRLVDKNVVHVSYTQNVVLPGLDTSLKEHSIFANSHPLYSLNELQAYILHLILVLVELLVVSIPIFNVCFLLVTQN